MNEFNNGIFVPYSIYFLSLPLSLPPSLLTVSLVSEADALAKIEVEEMFSDIKKPGPQVKN